MRSREDNAIFTNIPIEDIEFYEKTNDELEKENKQLKKIIDEAIEYIGNNSHKTEWGDLEQDNESIDINEDITETEFIEELLEILKGE